MVTKTLTMANTHTSLKTSIKQSRHVANTSIITSISLKYANDARIAVIDFEKERKPYEV